MCFYKNVISQKTIRNVCIAAQIYDKNDDDVNTGDDNQEIP